MKKILTLLCFLSTLYSISAQTESSEKVLINQSLTEWHQAAAQAKFDTYINLMTKDAVFIGTDATENWQLKDFKVFAKPYFDKGKAWSFTAIERNIYLDKDNSTTAWFDELLSTQMGICRSSGVLKKVSGIWKVQHYVLSIAVPNENVKSLTAMKKEWDNRFIETKKGN